MTQNDIHEAFRAHHGHNHGNWHDHQRHGPWGGDPRERGRGPRPGFGGRGGRGPWGGPGGGPFWGHHGGRDPRERLERGTLRYIILDLLSSGPTHGYEIIRQMEERTQGYYSPSPGTLYPTLQFMEEQGLLTSKQEDGKRVYELTDSGRAELADHADIPQSFWTHFRDQAATGAAMHELNFLKDALNDLTRTVGGGVRSAIYAEDPEAIRRIRTVLERAQSDVRQIIAQGTSGQPASGASEGPDNPGVQDA